MYLCPPLPQCSLGKAARHLPRGRIVDRYEEEILRYLETFHIPEDYQQQLLKLQRQFEKGY
jgi:hypothetical protein